ncbi:MAG: hypothetical protein MUO88_11755 [Desulfobacterales bacterium]|jgi:hypothetical protein|nr:hypothetical protein [Desulfobacterales bacterium]
MRVPLEAAFRDTGNNTGNIDLQARVKNATIKTSAKVDLKTQSFKSSFTITALDLGVLQLISVVYPSLKQISGKGQLNANGNLVYQDGQLSCIMALQGSTVESMESIVFAGIKGYRLHYQIET